MTRRGILVLFIGVLTAACGAGAASDEAQGTGSGAPVDQHLLVTDDDNGVTATGEWVVRTPGSAVDEIVQTSDSLTLTKGDYETVVITVRLKESGKEVTYKIDEDQQKVVIKTPQGNYEIGFSPRGDLLFEGREDWDVDTLAAALNSRPGFQSMDLSVQGISKQHIPDVEELAVSRGGVVNFFKPVFKALFKKVKVDCKFKLGASPECSVGL